MSVKTPQKELSADSNTYLQLGRQRSGKARKNRSEVTNYYHFYFSRRKNHEKHQHHEESRTH
jgi:hypothetical protein